MTGAPPPSTSESSEPSASLMPIGLSRSAYGHQPEASRPPGCVLGGLGYPDGTAGSGEIMGGELVEECMRFSCRLRSHVRVKDSSHIEHLCSFLPRCAFK